MPKGWGRDHGEGYEYQQEEPLRMLPMTFLMKQYVAGLLHISLSWFLVYQEYGV